MPSLNSKEESLKKDFEMKISFAVTVCNEADEIKRLLEILYKFKREEDEVVVQGDARKVTKDVVSVLHPYIKKGLQYLEFPLNNNFADFKNNLFKNCTGGWVFFIDADEYPHENLIQCLPELIDSAEYQMIEMLRVPRVNTVDGITDGWIKKWGWNAQVIHGFKTINFPDFQMRLVKNSKNIYWKNPVHEVLTGWMSYSDLPLDFNWSLFHPKTLEKQIKQNSYYETIG